MFTLIIGGAASGKSEFAEALVQRLPGPRVYLATMQPFDGECRARIQKHRVMRAKKDFTTIERYTGLLGAEVPSGSNLLLECMSNLVANERYSPDGAGEAAVSAVMQGVEVLLGKCRHLTIVTNEVFSGGRNYEGDTLGYLAQLGEVNRLLAARADAAVEIVAGMPNVLKGKELFPW